MKSIERIIEIPLSELQTNLPHKCGKNPCLICGKEIKDISKAKYVHLLTNGNIISYSGDDVENSQGFHAVGPECAKKLIINFSF